MNYPQALEYLDGFANLERSVLTRSSREVITLDRVRDLAAKLGNPQDVFPSLHVAGTKGKGSTCAFAEAMLSAAGFKTGLYVSPHLQDIRERISISGRTIPDVDFARILSACVPVLDKMRQPPEGERRPTYFEILTHLAFSWFAEEKVDAAVVEVGLGGRLDATNIVKPAVCGITNISFDHVAILGDTLEQIALEKSGIMKSGVPVVVAPQTPEVTRVLEQHAREMGCVCELVGRDLRVKVTETKIQDEYRQWSMPDASLTLPDSRVFQAVLGLRGNHQVENWAVAVRMADLFHRRTGPLPLSAVQFASRNVRWPGRLERVVPNGLSANESGNSICPNVYLDGAHNEHSLRVVLKEIRAHFTEKLIVLFACARDKDSGAMLRALAESGAIPIFTHSGNVRGKSPDELAHEWAQHTQNAIQPILQPSSAAGYETAKRMAGANGVVLVTGSLYLVGAIKNILP